MSRTGNETVAISVVIPTFNRHERLERVLRSLASQDVGEEIDVVVVSDGSTDGTEDYLASGDVPMPVTALSQENQGPSVARNLGVQHARGDLILFLDDDVVAHAGLLRSHIDAHRSLGERSVVIGPMLNPPDHVMSPWVRWEQEMLAKQYRAMLAGEYPATCRQFYTGNASLRRRQLLEVGGFDPSFRRAEDIELAFRLDDAGADFHFEPSAIGLHYAERSYQAWLQTAYAYGRNDMIFARDLGRGWLYAFVSDGFQQHHRAVRFLSKRAVLSDRWRMRSTALLEHIARFDRPGNVARYALSGIYAIEYHRGVADELGSVARFDHLMDTGEPL